MRGLLIPFLVGALAVGLAAQAVVVALAIVADANGWGSFELALGPLALLEFARSPDGTTATTFGPGVAVVALAGGLLNLAGALALRRR